jgi:hypothetical protein
MNAISFEEQTGLKKPTHEDSSQLPIWTDGDREVSCFEALGDDVSNVVLFRKLWLNQWQSGSVGLTAGNFAGDGLAAIQEYYKSISFGNLTETKIRDAVAQRHGQPDWEALMTFRSNQAKLPSLLYEVGLVSLWLVE